MICVRILSMQRSPCACRQQQRSSQQEGAAQHTSMAGAAAAVWAVTNSPRDSPCGAAARAAAPGTAPTVAQLQRLALALPPIPDQAIIAAPGEQQQVQQGQRASGAGTSSDGGSPGSPAAGRLLAEAAAAGRAARDAWQIPLSIQAHGALGLHGLAPVPTDSGQIWASIRGYHGEPAEPGISFSSCL